jgi:alpha-1,2-mannosyltransferase
VGVLLACAGVLVFPFQQNIVFGQVNSLALFFIVLCLFFSFRTRQEWLAGGALAAATLIKVTPAFLLMFFALNRKWKVLEGFAVGCAVFVLASFAVAGIVPWREFLSFLPEMGYARNVAGGFHPSIIANFSLAGFFMRLLPGEATAVRLLTITCVAVLSAILAHHHVRSTHHRSEQLLVLPYLVVMVVASPVTWLHHLVYVFPGAFLALRWSLHDQEGKCRWICIATLSSLSVLSGVDFQRLYPSMPVSEALRPWLTALNLWFLLLLFVASLFFGRRETSSLRTTLRK